MSKLLINFALINTKALVNAYTWTTLPFYALAQRPWRRLRLSKSFGIIATKDDQTGRIIYARPRQNHFSHYPHYKYSTFPEAFDQLNPDRKVIGFRDVISESLATDESGNPIRIEGKDLMKVKLSDQYRWLTVGEVMNHVDCVARGLKDLGVQKGDKVLIYAENGVEWFYTCLALARLNAVIVTLFSTLGQF